MAWSEKYSAETDFTIGITETGDNSGPFLYIGLALLGVTGLMAMYVMKKSEN